MEDDPMGLDLGASDDEDEDEMERQAELTSITSLPVRSAGRSSPVPVLPKPPSTGR